MTSRKIPKYTKVDGFILDETFPPENFRSATKYLPRDDDVIVATFPKCGTTWMCQIVLLILRKGDVPEDATYFECCPFLELQGAEAAENIARPGCIKTHLPFDRITFSKKARYIYVARHPRDCAVSFYHHLKFFPTYFFSNGTFDDFFELFIRGENDFNDYFDNLLSWYEHRNEPNVFFTTYEAMKADPRGTVLRVAEFLGPEHYTALVENSALLEEVMRKSSFDYMKKTVNTLFAEYFLKPRVPDDLYGKNKNQIREKALNSGHVSSGEFIRSGAVGEGKVVLSEEQEERLRARIVEKTKYTDVMSLWDC